MIPKEIEEQLEIIREQANKVSIHEWEITGEIREALGSLRAMIDHYIKEDKGNDS